MKITIASLAACAAVALAVPITPAKANMSCPAGSQEYNRQCWSPNPQQPAGGNASSTAGAVGVGTGIGVGIGKGGNSTATGGKGGAATATGGRGGAGGKGGNASSAATAGITGSGNSRAGASSNNSVQVNNSTRIKNAAAGAYATNLNGYGAGNCFGDTNPSGSFTAGMQSFGWGATAASSKASNVCAVYAIGGAAAALAYLAAMDPNAHRALVASGAVRTRAEPTSARVRCPDTHPVFVAGKGCRK